ncbi:hypothetical protein BpOF4_21544 (plasmid) [Alkalihalophilus pseudofirmus OF4]|uniref:DUF2922 domain-containing protein n=1 Tax=Alkalihalophilus pseudofirmus (strain ATCC BAA-2126 / JCM 17055 / OF4) TaxID=398511 RepID=D3G1S8_ALKPO|nr:MULTISPECIES: DUF2922 domain-containing protein [Alkalihalophilus]ADC52304.1 hypothetical protein BpOF4_21544 [Alkalihalophilus pseudofirmus OF4]MED1603313.1 DUF2922 domain-containing protein [Alkalihalophilus marmarensis]
MEKNLEMKFRDATKAVRTYRVPNPKEGLTAAEVVAVMDLIADKNVVGIHVNEKESARIVSRATTKIDI